MSQLRMTAEPELGIPVRLLAARELGVLELLVKFLHEERGMPLADIARLLSRDARTIWSAYSAAQRKASGPLLLKDGALTVPAAVFGDRRFGPLEAVCAHLKSTGRSYAEIGRMLNRDSRTIWTVCKRAERKGGSA